MLCRSLSGVPTHVDRYTDDGRKYYVNHALKTTSWEDPRAKVNVSGITLPKEWEARVDPRTNKQYFINHVTKTTTFDDPRLDVAAGKEDETEEERNFRYVPPFYSSA
jgi:hypothetical protein